MDINKIIDIVRTLKEEGMIANAVGAPGEGKIAGTVEAGDDPPVRRKKRYIYAKNTRKQWMA